MSESTPIVLLAGGITATNELVFAPAAQGGAPHFNWRIIPATGIFALALAGVDQVSPSLGRIIAATALVTILFTQVGNAQSPAVNLGEALGYIKKPG